MRQKKAIKKILSGAFRLIIPRFRKVKWGDFGQTEPFSREFGYDRGGPVDRYYIENFLQQNRHSIRGHVLEIGENEYSLHFGNTNVLQADILDIDANNAKANYIGDLADIATLPDETFDCIVLIQTLHLIYKSKKALENCFKALKPGGTLLLTVPGISQVYKDEYSKMWMWSFTGNMIGKMLGEIFHPRNIKVNTHGNVFAATTFLYGVGLPEVQTELLDQNDAHYQVIITAVATK